LSFICRLFVQTTQVLFVRNGGNATHAASMSARECLPLEVWESGQTHRIEWSVEANMAATLGATVSIFLEPASAFIPESPRMYTAADVANANIVGDANVLV
jgi:hypothetical protein